MALNYQKTNWVNNETKLNADNMNHIEDGIKNAYDEVDALKSDITSEYKLLEVSDLTQGA